jgi:hypothetical protein
MSGCISACLFAIVFTILEPSLWVEPESVGHLLSQVWGTISVYLIYSFPVLLVYGSLTSMLSDWLVSSFTTYIGSTRPLLQKIMLAALHLLFGCILSYIGILAALLYFLVDLWLSRKPEPYRAVHVLISFCFPVGLFLLAVISLQLVQS